MKGQRVLFSTRVKDDWGSPKSIVWWSNKQFGPFTIDLAADASNTVCERFYDEQADSLKQNWIGENGWLNFPYSQGKKFITKTGNSIIEAREQHNWNTRFTLLAPVRSSNKEWYSVIFPLVEVIVFIEGRLIFEGAEYGAPFPSCLLHFSSNPTRRWSHYDTPRILTINAKEVQEAYTRENPT